MIKLYANPYAFDASGFYFSDMDEFTAEYEAHLPVEEYSIEFIDGDDDERRLFDAVKPSGNPAEFFDALDHLSGNPAEFLDAIDQLSGNEIDGYCYLRDCGYDHDRALRKAGEVCIFEGSAEDYAAQCVDDGLFGDIPKAIASYIDYAAIANDLQCGSDITEIRPGVWVTNANDF